MRKFVTDDYFFPTTRVLYKILRERVRELHMQHTEPLAAILLEQGEEPTESW